MGVTQEEESSQQNISFVQRALLFRRDGSDNAKLIVRAAVHKKNK